MRKVTVFLCCLGLAACATAPDLYASDVDETALIARPVSEVSECLGRQLGTAPVMTDGNPSFYIRSAYGDPLAVFTLVPDDAGTKLEIRRRSISFATGMWRECQ